MELSNSADAWPPSSSINFNPIFAKAHEGSGFHSQKTNPHPHQRTFPPVLPCNRSLSKAPLPISPFPSPHQHRYTLSPKHAHSGPGLGPDRSIFHHLLSTPCIGFVCVCANSEAHKVSSKNRGMYGLSFTGNAMILSARSINPKIPLCMFAQPKTGGS